MPYPVPPASPLTIAFFIKFARFEFAMKRAGYVRADEKGRAGPHWDKLRDSDELRALEDVLMGDGAVRYLVEHPPRWMRYDPETGELDWQDIPDIPHPIVRLFWSLGRARNNLFHGDKAFVGGEHDIHLLTGGLRALDLILDGLPNLRQHFLAAA